MIPSFSFSLSDEKKKIDFNEHIRMKLDKGILGLNSSLRPLLFGNINYNCSWMILSNKPNIKGWVTVKAKRWFERLKSFHEKWENQRIISFLQLATYTNIPFDGELTSTLVSLWDPVLNCFVLRQILMTVTLADIAFITGLSPTSDEHSNIPVFTLLPQANKLYYNALNLYNEITNYGKKIGFSLFVQYFSSSSKVTLEEEVIFLLFAFTRLMMNKSGGVSTLYLTLAANVASKTTVVALGPIILGQLYRCLF